MYLPPMARTVTDQPEIVLVVVLLLVIITEETAIGSSLCYLRFLL